MDKTKLIAFGVILIVLVAGGGFLMGRNTSNLFITQIFSTFPKPQTPYEKCMYQCMEGKTETVKYCSSDLKDYIDNYDKYYSPYGVSSAFASKYSDPTNPNSLEAGYKVLCFMQVVSCRKSLCQDYLND